MTAVVPVLAIALLLVVLERVPRLRNRALPVFRRGFRTDALHVLTSRVAGLSLALAAAEGASAWLADVAHVPRLAAGLPRWAAITVALLAVDAGNYLAHWAMHRFDVLWELHKVHHSSPDLDWLATFREHPLEEWWRRSCALLPIVLLGLPLDAAAVGAAIVAAWGVLNHANLRPGFRLLEGFLVTPELHRLHHVPRTSERNLGIVFVCWDRLRGTLVRGGVPTDAPLGVPAEPAYPQTWGAHQLVPLGRLLGRLDRRRVRLASRPS